MNSTECSMNFEDIIYSRSKWKDMSVYSFWSTDIAMRVISSRSEKQQPRHGDVYIYHHLSACWT